MAKPKPFTVLRHPHFESFAVEWKGAKTELKKLASDLLGPEWTVRPLHGDFLEIVNPAHLKGGWEPVRAAADSDPARTPPSELPSREAWEIARKIRKHPKAAFAEPLFSVYTPPPEDVGGSAALSSGGGDPPIAGALADCEWALTKAGVIDAWKITAKPGDGVRIGHPDTGYQFHPELDINRLLLSEDRDLIEDDDDALDPLTGGGLFKSPGHGTATGSVIVSARGTTSPFVSGVAPHAKLIPIRTSPTVVLLSMRNLIRALDYAIKLKCHVVSISMGGLGSFALHRVLQDAVAAGLIVVAAAGNKVRFVVHPGGYPEAVCIAGSNFDDGTWEKSCRGPEVTVSAPSESVWRARVFHKSGKIKTSVETSSGTSYGVAITAGIAAMWLSHHGRASLIQRLGGAHLLGPTFKNILMATVRKPAKGWNTAEYGAGIVDAKAVLEADPKAFVPASAASPVAVTPAHEVRRRLATIAGVTRRNEGAIAGAIGVLAGAASGKASAARIADLGPEIAFLAATDPAVQEALRSAASAKTSAVAAGAEGKAIRALRNTLARKRGKLSATAGGALGL